jgi:hypothetical protein
MEGIHLLAGDNRESARPHAADHPLARADEVIE